MCPTDFEPSDPDHSEFVVVCLCAEWCGTCREYRAGFEQLAKRFPGTTVLWWDIEDRADSLGDLEIEDFPTILIRRGESVLFYGTMLPQIGHLVRLMETFLEQTPEESRTYALSSSERSDWQKDPDISGIGLG